MNSSSSAGVLLDDVDGALTLDDDEGQWAGMRLEEQRDERRDSSHGHPDLDSDPMPPGDRRLFRPVRAADRYVHVIPVTRHADLPRIAAHFAVLDVTAAHVQLDVDLNLFAAVGAGDPPGLVRVHRVLLRVVCRA